MSSAKLFRAEDWWVGKASLLIGLVYLFSIYFFIPFQSFWWWAFWSLITIVGFASFGYLVNDFFDQKKDALVGKKNFLNGTNTIQKIFYFLIALVLLASPWIFLPHDFTTYVLILFQLLAYFFYSLPIVRLKERGILGVIVDALYAHAIPALLAAYTYALVAKRTPNFLFLTLLFVWQFLVGIRNILLHQLSDLESDKLSNTNTFALLGDSTILKKTLRLFKVIEILLISFLLLILCFYNIFFVISISAILLALVTNRYMNRDNGYKKNFPNILYEQWLPYSFIFILSILDLKFLILLLFQSFFFSGIFVEYFYKKIPFKYYSDTIILNIIYLLRHFLNQIKWLGNWFIYLLFRAFGVDLVKEKIDAKGYILRKLNRQK